MFTNEIWIWQSIWIFGSKETCIDMFWRTFQRSARELPSETRSCIFDDVPYLSCCLFHVVVRLFVSSDAGRLCTCTWVPSYMYMCICIYWRRLRRVIAAPPHKLPLHNPSENSLKFPSCAKWFLLELNLLLYHTLWFKNTEKRGPKERKREREKVNKREREKERKREREKERKRKREKDRKTEREKERKREREKERNVHKGSPTTPKRVSF